MANVKWKSMPNGFFPHIFLDWFWKNCEDSLLRSLAIVNNECRTWAAQMYQTWLWCIQQHWWQHLQSWQCQDGSKSTPWELAVFDAPAESSGGTRSESTHRLAQATGSDGSVKWLLEHCRSMNGIAASYPLVMTNIAIENHNFQLENSL